jgi:hypothetical protein
MLAMSSEDRANGKPDLRLDAGVLQTEIAAELGLPHWGVLPLVP